MKLIIQAYADAGLLHELLTVSQTYSLELSFPKSLEPSVQVSKEIIYLGDKAIEYVLLDNVISEYDFTNNFNLIKNMETKFTATALTSKGSFYDMIIDESCNLHNSRITKQTSTGGFKSIRVDRIISLKCIIRQEKL